MNWQFRENIKIGTLVSVVLKKDQRSGILTRGHIGKILTKSSFHPHGIKVMLLESNAVGRVREIFDKDLELG